MRDIKFRGKDLGGNWRVGDLIAMDCVTPSIMDERGERIPVQADTVGQYTGRDDCEGNPIYEGDIIGLPSIYAKDQQGYTPFWVVEYDPWQGFKGFPREKVLGNLHDNPELLKP